MSAPGVIYTLSLHDALPISGLRRDPDHLHARGQGPENPASRRGYLLDNQQQYRQIYSDALLRRQDRKSTRLNSSYVSISYAVFCLKKETGTGHSTPKLIYSL